MKSDEKILMFVSTYIDYPYGILSKVESQWNQFLLGLYLSETNNYEKAVVSKNVDGDTINVTLNGKTEKIRMIGVDTPETVHPSKPVEFYGKEASDFTKSMVPVGSEVYLTFDWNPRDKYDRLLAYVWFKQDGLWVLHNLSLISNGYGNAYTAFSFKNEYMTLFRSAESYARNNQRGLWQNSKPVKQTTTTNTYQNNTSNTSNSSGSIIIAYVKYDSKVEYVELKNTGSTSVNLSGWKLISVKGNQSYRLSGSLSAGQSIKIYSGPDTSGCVWTKRYIHNNDGDEVKLYDASGKVIDSEKW